jgi:hypothetical protein
MSTRNEVSEPDSVSWAGVVWSYATFAEDNAVHEADVDDANRDVEPYGDDYRCLIEIDSKHVMVALCRGTKSWSGAATNESLCPMPIHIDELDHWAACDLQVGGASTEGGALSPSDVASRYTRLSSCTRIEQVRQLVDELLDDVNGLEDSQAADEGDDEQIEVTATEKHQMLNLSSTRLIRVLVDDSGSVSGVTFNSLEWAGMLTEYAEMKLMPDEKDGTGAFLRAALKRLCTERKLEARVTSLLTTTREEADELDSVLDLLVSPGAKDDDSAENDTDVAGHENDDGESADKYKVIAVQAAVRAGERRERRIARERQHYAAAFCAELNKVKHEQLQRLQQEKHTTQDDSRRVMPSDLM